MNKILKYFGYVKLDDINIILDSRIYQLKNQVPYPKVDTEGFDKMCKRDKAFWFQQRYEWNSNAEELGLIKYSINKL